MNILIIDDEIAICKLTQKMCKKGGYSADYGFNQKDALKLFSHTKKYDVLIVDYHIGEERGDVVCEAIRSAGYNPYIIMASGSANCQAIAHRIKCYKCLMKPYGYKELLNILKEIKSLIK